MTTPQDSLIVVPLNRLPAEKKGLGDKAIEDQKRFIRERILGVRNRVLVDDTEAWDLLATLGGDLMINAFSCNFRINGEPNRDVVSE